jgi:hypothetical protein
VKKAQKHTPRVLRLLELQELHFFDLGLGGRRLLHFGLLAFTCLRNNRSRSGCFALGGRNGLGSRNFALGGGRCQLLLRHELVVHAAELDTAHHTARVLNQLGDILINNTA